MKISWSKVFLVTADTLLAAYLVFAFSSLNAKGTTQERCNKVSIDIADGATNGFIDAKEIRQRLVTAGIYPIDQKISEIDTRSIEDKLRRSPFVKTAECYKTQDGHVYVSITQRMPIVRIKADSGDDYYVDDNNCVMPRSNYTSDLIIATGSIDRWYATNYIAPLSKAILANELWRNLVEQIHVLPGHGIEIVPRIGEHIVFIGRLPDGKGRGAHQKAITEYVDKKFTRLEKFYKYGLSQVGWNKYSYINVEFDNQIICKKAGHTAPEPEAEEPAVGQQPTEAQAQKPEAQSAATPETPKEEKKNAPKESKKDTPKESKKNAPKAQEQVKGTKKTT